MSESSADKEAMFEILMNTVQELWVLKDRQAVLEKVLEERGIDVTDTVERYQPDAEFEKALAAERQRFLAGILKPVASDD